MEFTDQQRIELFTLLQQWSRNTELQAQKVAEWISKTVAPLEAQIAACEAIIGKLQGEPEPWKEGQPWTAKTARQRRGGTFGT